MSSLIQQALTKFEHAHRDAVRKDTIAEQQEQWEARALRACEKAWKKCTRRAYGRD
jgi:hypothetical protein